MVNGEREQEAGYGSLEYWKRYQAEDTHLGVADTQSQETDTTRSAKERKQTEKNRQKKTVIATTFRDQREEEESAKGTEKTDW